MMRPDGDTDGPALEAGTLLEPRPGGQDDLRRFQCRPGRPRHADCSLPVGAVEAPRLIASSPASITEALAMQPRDCCSESGYRAQLGGPLSDAEAAWVWHGHRLSRRQLALPLRSLGLGRWRQRSPVLGRGASSRLGPVPLPDMTLSQPSHGSWPIPCAAWHADRAAEMGGAHCMASPMNMNELRGGVRRGRCRDAVGPVLEAGTLPNPRPGGHARRRQ